MTTTNYIWDEQNYLAEADGPNTIQTVYTNEPEQYGNLISSRISGTTSYHHFDGIGSTWQLTNAAGTVTDTIIYDAWGNVVSRTGSTPTRRLWVGVLTYYTDPETGLIWILARPYGPAIARWTSTDPVGFVDSLDLYRYVDNSPSSADDPTGRLRHRRVAGPVTDRPISGPAQETGGPPPGAPLIASPPGAALPPPGAPGWFAGWGCGLIKGVWAPKYCRPTAETANCKCSCVDVMGERAIDLDTLKALASDVQAALKLGKLACKFTIIQGKCDMGQAQGAGFFMCSKPAGGSREFFVCFGDGVDWCTARAALYYLFTQMNNECNAAPLPDCKARALPGLIQLDKASDAEKCRRRDDKDIKVDAGRLAARMCAGQKPPAPDGDGGGDAPWDPIGGKTCEQWIEDNFP